MKYLDKVKVINLKEYYKADGISLGEIGVIWASEIRDNTFYVMFDNDSDNKFYNDIPGEFFKYSIIDIEDLEFVEDGGITDEELLKDLPKNDPRWWCKVENGFILNLLGEKKNKIPYDYNS